MSDLRALVDQVLAHYEQIGLSLRALDQAVPRDTVLRIGPDANVQTAFASLYETGGTLLLAPGKYPALVLSPRPSDALITIRSQLPDNRACVEAFTAGPKTRHVTFADLTFHRDGLPRANHLALGGDASTLRLEDDIPFGFSFLHCGFLGGTRRGIMANCDGLLVEHCTFDNYYAAGQDSQAICGWNGARNHVIRQNTICAASENILYGGADAALPDDTEVMFPRNILIEENDLYKKREWLPLSYNMKTLCELKNARDVTIRANRFHDNWKEAWATAEGLTIKSSNQESHNPTACSRDILVEGNEFYNLGDYIMIVGKDDGPYTSDYVRNVIIRNNRCHDMHSEGSGRNIRLLDAPQDTVIEENTMFDNRHSFLEILGVLPDRVTFQRNICRHGTYGLLPAHDPSYMTISANAIEINPNRRVKLPESNLYVTAPIKAWAPTFACGAETDDQP
jgi:hypothetical protein